MTTDRRLLSHPLRPAFDLVALVALGALTGVVILNLQSTGLSWVDGASRSVVGFHAHEGINRLMIGITSFGEEIVLVAAFLTVAMWARARRGAQWGRFFTLVGIGAVTLDNIIKPIVGRSRPVFDQLVGGRGDSFPSGHVVATTALLFALAWYLSGGRTTHPRRWIWGLAGAGSVLMALSRVYLGVHWPTDVMAGMTLGAAWTAMCARSQLGWRMEPRPLRLYTARRRLVATIGSFALIGLACSPSSSSSSDVTPETTPASQTGSYDPAIHPADFVARIDNPYLPLVPGTVFELRGATEDGIERETITVTDRTREVMGVRTTVVRDVVRVDGDVAEFTHDWYAQDEQGNVWYFGENTAEMENGKVLNRHGSWEAGVDGAQPGIIMNAEPQVLDSYRQEYYAGEAEDMYWVVAEGETVSAPAGNFHDAIRTLEWNPLEPRIIVEKFYAPGVGLVSERALSGGKEVVELLSITPP